MRIIFISIVSLILSLDLYARENPFEPTDTFIQIQKQYIIAQEKQEIERKKIEDEQILEKQKQDLLEKRLLEEKAKEELIAQKKQEEEKLAQEKIKKQLLQKLLEKQKQEEEKKILESTINYKILSFINAKTTTDTLVITIDKKYKLKNQDILHKNKKFVFDFIGSVNMYTKRVKLEHEYFESITIGSHMKNNFFRVVILLKDVIAKYEENIDNSTITIKKIK
ncbi:MAG: AMIN domain-containing protein [Campylobacterota bacterium]|nr:AMIN domain-containing protein [Campylobacterota bacterium]